MTDQVAVKKLRPARPLIPIDPTAPVIPDWRIDLESGNAGSYSRMSDMRWDLCPGINRANTPPAERFMQHANYPPEFADLVWEYSWLCMNFDHSGLPVRIEPIPPGGVKKEATRLVRYLRFMQSRNVDLAQVSDEDNDAWMANFKERDYSTRVRNSSIPKRLYCYRHSLSFQVSNVEPWKFREPRDVLGKAPLTGENTTERVPRSILDPMMRWALFLTEQASDDMMAIAEAAHRNGCSGPSHFACFPGTNTPWRARESLSHWRQRAHEINYFTTAVYIVTAYLSGMRDGEVQAITKGSRRVRRDSEGTPYRFFVRSTAVKTRGSNRGAKRVWVVLPEVYYALEKLERFYDLMFELKRSAFHTRDSRLLFRRYSRIKSPYSAVTSSINQWLKDFESYVNMLALEASKRAASKNDANIINNLYVVPPKVDGTRWRWISKQFRRTVAWYIANEPFGVVAGMRQFGHVRETTYQGYAGRWEAGFRDEIDAAREVGKMHDLLEMYETVRDGGSLGGPKGKVLEAEFRNIAASLGDLPGVIVDDKRLLGMLKNCAVQVYPGIINDCFFDASTAQCLANVKSGKRDRPIFARCDEAKCPNSCFWHKHQPALLLAIDDAKRMQKVQRLSKHQRGALDYVISKYKKLIGTISHARQKRN